ncbi:MAG: fibronectin type III domain-containing protein [Elusimicrobia bacterium]|nr:fibronectin type III domain-containing protein [Elusimicrobiota bacterium]
MRFGKSKPLSLINRKRGKSIVFCLTILLFPIFANAQRVNTSFYKLPLGLSQFNIQDISVSSFTEHMFVTGYNYGSSKYEFHVYDVNIPTAPVYKLDYCSQSFGIECLPTFHPIFAHKNYLIYGAKSIIDISSPINPKKYDITGLPYYIFYSSGSVSIDGNYAYYILPDRSIYTKPYLVVVDISTPTNAYVTSTYELPSETHYGISFPPIKVDAYLLISLSRGIAVMDVSNPSAPVLIKFWSYDKPGPITKVGNYLYIFPWRLSIELKNSLEVLDIANLPNITTIAKVNSFISHDAWTSLLFGNYLFLSQSRGLSVFDVSIASQPLYLTKRNISYPGGASEFARLSDFIYIGNNDIYAATITPTLTYDSLPPSKITDLTVTQITRTSTNLSWTPCTDADTIGYRLYKSTIGINGPFYVIETEDTVLDNISVSTYADSYCDFSKPASYFYAISAVDLSSNESELSLPIIADNIPPQITVLSPQNSEMHNYYSLKFEGNLSDESGMGKSYIYAWRTDKYGNIQYTGETQYLPENTTYWLFPPKTFIWNAEQSTGAPNGNYFLKVISFDKLHNESTKQISFLYDNQSPGIIKLVQYPGTLSAGILASTQTILNGISSDETPPTYQQEFYAYSGIKETKLAISSSGTFVNGKLYLNFWNGSLWTENIAYEDIYSSAPFFLTSGKENWEFDTFGILWPKLDIFYIAWIKGEDLVGNISSTPNRSYFWVTNKSPASQITYPENGKRYYVLNAISGTAYTPRYFVTNIGAIANVEISIYSPTENLYWNNKTWVSSTTWLSAVPVDGKFDEQTEEWNFQLEGFSGFPDKEYIIASRSMNTAGIIQYPYTQITITKYTNLPPNAISDLIITTATENSLTLRWTSPSDDGETGNATQYEIRYSTTLPFNFSQATLVESPPYPEPAGTISTFTVTGLFPGTTYYFAIKSKDEIGNISNISNIAKGITLPDKTPPNPVTDLQAVYNSVKQTNPAVLEPKNSDIFLQWTRPSDLSGVFSYKIFRSTTLDQTGDNIALFYISQMNEGVRTLLGGKDYFVDNGSPLPNGATFYYTVYPIDRGENIQEIGNNQSNGIIIDHLPPQIFAELSSTEAFIFDPIDLDILRTKRLPKAKEASFDFTKAIDIGDSGGIYRVDLLVNGIAYPLPEGATFYQVHSDTSSLLDADDGASKSGCLQFAALDKAGNRGVSEEKCIIWDGLSPLYSFSINPSVAGGGEIVTIEMQFGEPILTPPEVKIRQSGLSEGATIAMSPDPYDPYFTFIGTYSVVNGYDGYAIVIGSATDIVGNTISAIDTGDGFDVNTGNPIYNARTNFDEYTIWNPAYGPININVDLRRTLDLKLEIFQKNIDGSSTTVHVSTFTNQSYSVYSNWDGKSDGVFLDYDNPCVYKWTAFEPGTEFLTQTGIPLQGNILMGRNVTLNFTNLFPVNSEIRIIPVIDYEGYEAAIRGGNIFISAIYDIQPDNTYFDPPASLTICAPYPLGTERIKRYDPIIVDWEDVIPQDLPVGNCITAYITNVSKYALLRPLVKELKISLDFDPDTLNLKSQGQYVTAYMEITGLRTAQEIKPETIKIASINDNLLPTPLPIVLETAGKSGKLKFAEIGDYNENNISDLMVKFDRQKLIEILPLGEQVKLTIEENFTDNSKFITEDYIRTILPENISASLGGSLTHPSNAKIEIPANALISDTDIIILKISKEPKEKNEEKEKSAKFKNIKRIGYLYAFGPEGAKFLKPLEIVLPYDSASIQPDEENALKIAYWNAQTKTWEILDSLVNNTNKEVSAKTGHFSIYQIVSTNEPLQVQSDFKLGEVYVYPNPARGGAVPVFHIETGIADRVEIYIYNVSGELAHKTVLTGIPQLIDDGQGQQYAYEYSWSGYISSGIYLYIVKTEKSGLETLKKTGRFAVVR